MTYPCQSPISVVSVEIAVSSVEKFHTTVVDFHMYFHFVTTIFAADAVQFFSAETALLVFVSGYYIIIITIASSGLTIILSMMVFS